MTVTGMAEAEAKGGLVELADKAEDVVVAGDGVAPFSLRLRARKASHWRMPSMIQQCRAKETVMLAVIRITVPGTLETTREVLGQEAWATRRAPTVPTAAKMTTMRML